MIRRLAKDTGWVLCVGAAAAVVSYVGTWLYASTYAFIERRGK